jgi:hypothetical protein
VGEICNTSDLKAQLEKWLSSSASNAEVLKLESVAEDPSERLILALIPRMFCFAGVSQGMCRLVNYFKKVLPKEKNGRVALDPEDYFGSQADPLVERLSGPTKPDEVLRVK